MGGQKRRTAGVQRRRGLGVGAVAYRALAPEAGLLAPIRLAVRRDDPSAVLVRFRALVGTMKTSPA